VVYVHLLLLQSSVLKQALFLACRKLFCFWNLWTVNHLHPLCEGGDYYTLNVWSLRKQLVLFSQESWCFLRQSQWKHLDVRENKTNWFPKGPHFKCFVIYWNSPLNNHIAKKETIINQADVSICWRSHLFFI